MPLGELPGRLASGIGKAAKGVGGFMGFNDSMLNDQQKEYQAQTGMNPRREMWAAALSNLGQVGKGGGPGTAAMQMKHQQQQMMERQKQQQLLNQQKQHTLETQRLNAEKTPDSRTPYQKEADELFPGDQAAQSQWIKATREKASTHVNNPIQDKGQVEMNKMLIKEIPAMRETASASADALARNQTLMSLVDHLGNTGTGKSAMTSAKTFFNTVGAGGAIDWVDAIGEAANIDIWSGETGAIELARALNNDEILTKAQSMKGNLSNKDLNFLRESADILSMSDPNAMKALIESRIAPHQRNLDYYNQTATYLGSQFEGAPSIPQIQVQGRRGLGGNSEVSDDKREGFYKKYNLEMPK